MICDKCGFEHNSKSVCPKCGARVVYVDEEYLKRKKAWEEAQKKGSDGERDFTQTLPPGIMFSSRDDDPKRPEPDEDFEEDEEGAGFFTSLSFGVIKEKITTAFSLTIRFIKSLISKRAQRRADKRDTVVRRESVKIKLDNKRKKQIIILAVAVVAVLIVVIATIRLTRGKDSTSIMVYDGKYAYYADDMDDPIWGSKDGVTFIAAQETDRYMVWGDDGVSYYSGSKEEELTQSSGEIKVIVKDADMSLIFFMQDNKYYLYSEDGLKEVELPDKGDVTEECSVSDNGEYYTITLFDSDSESYTLLEGTTDGTVKEICTDSGRISIIHTASDGQVVYLSMDTAEYGIINDVRLCSYNGESTTQLADSIVDAEYINDYIFYITEDEKLCRIDRENNETATIAKQVTAFSDSTVYNVEDSFMYETEDGYYCLDTSSDEPELLFSSSSNALTIYYDPDKDYLYYTDMNSVYFVPEKGGTSEKILDISSEEQLVELDDILLAVGTDNKLYELTDSYEVIDENVSSVQKIENYNGYCFIKDGVRYYSSGPNVSEIQISSEGEKNLTDTSVIYSDKYFYYLDSSSVLWKISMDGDDRTSLGTTKYFMLIK